MKIDVAGTEYELSEAVQLASIGTLKRLTSLSATTGPAVTMDFLEKQIERLDALQADPEFRVIELYGDADYLTALSAFVYLAKRWAGEDPSWDDAESFSPGQITFPQEQAVVDPKESSVEPEPDLPVE